MIYIFTRYQEHRGVKKEYKLIVWCESMLMNMEHNFVYVYFFEVQVYLNGYLNA